jgi:hypothetical protein
MKESINNKIFFWYFAVTLSIYPEINAYASQNFYHGTEFKRSNFSWQQKDTEHFVVMYKDRYFDPEQVLKNLSEKFGIPPIISGIKIRLFIDDDSPYTIVGAKIIHACDEQALVHELTHVLFIQLNRNAPRSMAEGIAVYAQAQETVNAPYVDVREIIAIEKDFNRGFRTSAGRGVYARQGTRSKEKQLYSEGFCFVKNIISKRGIEAFKEFYKKCSSAGNMQTAWDQVYK